jgi:3-hydroxyisobutyrate dehydrogenase-like beta-hydroxyacid dehydrogenase
MADTPKQHPPTGIIGLGIIGSRIHEAVTKAGFTTFVWSRSPRAVPNFLADPAAVAQAARWIELFVRDDAALLDAVQQMQPHLGPDHVIINHATVSPQATRQAAQIVQAQGAAFLDCPFTGSKNAAAAAKLIYYVGGDEAVLQRVRPLLETSSSKIMHVGEIGHATVLKVTTNVITAITVKGIQEALAITQACGVSGQKLLEVEEPNANFSPLIGMKLPAMLQQQFDAHFSLTNMLKDADIALQLAAESGLQTPALTAMADAMRTKFDAGHADADFSIIGQA